MRKSLNDDWGYRLEESFLGSEGKESAYNAGDLGSISVGRSPGEGNGYPLSILAWRIPRREESGGLQFMGSQGVVHEWAANTLGDNKEFRMKRKFHVISRCLFSGRELWRVLCPFLLLLNGCAGYRLCRSCSNSKGKCYVAFKQYSSLGLGGTLTPNFREKIFSKNFHNFGEKFLL